jgi:nucleotide-binding universal stress UspA family protein
VSALVVGYDGTEGAKAALDEAARLAADLEAGIVAVFAHATSRLGGEVRDYDDAIREVGRGHLEAARATLRQAGLEPEIELLALDPAEGLIDAAERHAARMIVVGSYGERPLKSALVGSTPTRLLHLSERPVLVVRAPG